ncbi:hypothetical protein MTO96_018820 [Rhipicephalus appendiculatus]
MRTRKTLAGGTRGTSWEATTNYIVEIAVPLSSRGTVTKSSNGVRTHKVTDWDAFRGSLPAEKRTAQLKRLSGTRTGRQVLRNLGMEPRRADEETAEGAEVPECVRRHVQVRPIPKNVNPEYNRERRAARARALIDLHARDNGAVYVDAAEYKDRRGAFAAAVVSAVTGETKAAASVRARAAHRAEENFDYPNLFRITLMLPQELQVEALGRILAFCKAHRAR